MDISAIERNRRGLKFHLENMPHVIDKIRFRRKPLSLENCYSSLSDDHLAVGVHDYFVKGNLQSFKQNLHVASKLKIVAIALNDYQRFTVGSEILYALLSDSPTVIDTMAKMEPQYFVGGRTNPLNSEFIVHMYQLAMRGDYEALQSKVDRLSKNGRKKERLLATQCKDFFSLLIRGDKQGLEDLIGKHARVKSENALIGDFMSFQGVLEAKLCWFKNIQVQIESPLLPMALMPIEPLEHYDDVYDFLEPDFVPPIVSLIEKVRYWYQERARGKARMKALMEAQRR